MTVDDDDDDENDDDGDDSEWWWSTFWLTDMWLHRIGEHKITI